MIDSCKWMSPALPLFLPICLLMVIATTIAGAPLHDARTDVKDTGSGLTTKHDGNRVTYPVTIPQVGPSDSLDLVFPSAESARDRKEMQPPRLDPPAFETPRRPPGGDGASNPSVRVDPQKAPGFTPSEKPNLYGNGQLQPESSELEFSSRAGNEDASHGAPGPVTITSADTLDYDFDEPPAPWPSTWNYAVAVLVLGSGMVIALCVIAFRHRSV